MRAFLIGVTVFLLAAGSTITTAFCQSVTVLSQVYDCTVQHERNRVQCQFNVLIIDRKYDQRISCSFAMGIYYELKQDPPINFRYVNPSKDGNVRVRDCFLQRGVGGSPGAGTLADISSRQNGDLRGEKLLSPSANAYIIYTGDLQRQNVTFCMNAGSLIKGPSETYCEDANVRPF
jgi:hypothetical protein